MKDEGTTLCMQIHSKARKEFLGLFQFKLGSLMGSGSSILCGSFFLWGESYRLVPKCREERRKLLIFGWALNWTLFAGLWTLMEIHRLKKVMPIKTDRSLCIIADVWESRQKTKVTSTRLYHPQGSIIFLGNSLLFAFQAYQKSAFCFLD